MYEDVTALNQGGFTLRDLITLMLRHFLTLLEIGA